MKQNYYAPGRVNPHLPHDGIELEPVPADMEAAQRDADLLVSQLMETSTKPVSRPVTTPVSKPVAQSVAPAPAIDETWIEIAPARTDMDLYPRKVVIADEGLVPEAVKEAVTEAVEFRDEKVVTKDLRATFPKLSDAALAESNKGKPTLFERVPPIYMAAAVGVLLAFVAPMLLLWTVLAAVAALLVAAAMMKVPGLSHLSRWMWNGFVSRAPERAEKVRKMADNAALSFEYLLDRLPGSLAEKISLPDFSQPVARKR